MKTLFATFLGAAALLSSAAMAQSSPPEGDRSQSAILRGAEPVAMCEAPWSRNPEPFHVDTATPAYVQHDHGAP